jgi:NADPH:quinone reductase
MQKRIWTNQTKTMKAVQLTEHGEPELLKVVEVDEPKLKKPTDIKVKLKAAGINPVDTKLRVGAYPIITFPAILGCDGAGIVEECGASVTRFKQGDEVYFFSGGIASVQGNYAEYKVLNERFVAHKPKSIDFNQAAAAPLVLLTAWEALFDRARLEKDQTIFINAGAGGVGHVAIQLAKHIGAKVCTTISDNQKAIFVDELGADFIINYKNQNVAESILEWTGNEGVDVFLDNLGGPAIQEVLTAIKYYGDIVTLLQPDDSIDWSVARFRNLRLSFEVMLSPLLFDLKEAQNHQTWILEQCAKLIDDGKLKIHVSDALPLEEAAKAHSMIEKGHTTGKIVLEI